MVISDTNVIADFDFAKSRVGRIDLRFRSSCGMMRDGSLGQRGENR